MSAARQIWNGWRRYLRAENGMAAVEFGLIVAPATWLIVGLLEITMIAYAQNSLDFAMGEAARRIRIGEVDTLNLTEEQLKGDICDSMGGLVTTDCNRLYLDVDEYDGFIDVQNASPILPNGTMDQGQFGWNPGTCSSIVLVRGFYEWKVITPFFEGFFANVGDRRLLTSSILFRNEPWCLAGA